MNPDQSKEVDSDRESREELLKRLIQALENVLEISRKNSVAYGIAKKALEKANEVSGMADTKKQSQEVV